MIINPLALLPLFAREYGVTLVFATQDARYRGTPIAGENRAQVSGSAWDGTAEIVMGGFANANYACAAFFHELGHALDRTPYSPGDGRYAAEKRAWLIGLSEAAGRGLRFESHTLRWAGAQLGTYVGWEGEAKPRPAHDNCLFLPLFPPPAKPAR